MKRLSYLLAGAALCAFPATIANADCRQELASLSDDSAVTASTNGGAATNSAATGTTTNFETNEVSGADAGDATQSAEVSKDGSLAPLESSSEASSAGSQSADAQADSSQQSSTSASSDDTASNAASEGVGTGEVSKDGQTMPMASSQGGGEKNMAMSGQDANAQQAGNETAMASTGQGTDNPSDASSSATDGGSYQMALNRAQTALDEGNEEACLAAVEEARNMQAEGASNQSSQ